MDSFFIKDQNEYRIRCVVEEDLPSLERLDRECWPEELWTPVELLRKRITRYPEGQLVLETGHNVIGAIYSQRVSNPDEVKTSTVVTVEDLHTSDGAYIQLLSLNILPEYRKQKLGDQLLVFMLERCRQTNRIKAVIGVSRCRDYGKHASSLPLHEYISFRNEAGNLADATLRFHEDHGARIGPLVPGYRPMDLENQGHGVWVYYEMN